MEVALSLDAHIRQLNERHRELEREIEEETRHAAADEARVHTLKKRKLRLKDEIVELARRGPVAT